MKLRISVFQNIKTSQGSFYIISGEIGYFSLEKGNHFMSERKFEKGLLNRLLLFLRLILGSNRYKIKLTNAENFHYVKDYFASVHQIAFA